MATSAEAAHDNRTLTLSQRFALVRGTTMELTRTLAPEDTVVQSMPDVSPSKWHLAHVTWFFEHFVLQHFDPAYKVYEDDWHFLFNSYYFSVGQMHARAQRGLLSRPTFDEVCAYRAYVDNSVIQLVERNPDNAEIAQRIELGLNHEQQHQELLLTDIKHVLSCNPLKPAMRKDLPVPPSKSVAPLDWIDGADGVQLIGADGEHGFCFDNETPRHEVLVQPHAIANRLITNGEFRDFIQSGAYGNSQLWLSDGWSVINERGWQRPLYWNESLAAEFTLGGMRELDINAPVTHLSYYEADAFARWAGARLPTEAEWELASLQSDSLGNLMEATYWQPISGNGQFFGDCWEWTSSAYAPYPGFKPLGGELGEYNGKFMCNQMTVRGGSCVTARDHIRATYRSFFYPDARWQYLGLRMARDT